MVPILRTPRLYSGAFVMSSTVNGMDPLEDTLPRTYTCPLCPWEFTTYFGVKMIRAVAEHDRVEHDIPDRSDTEPPC